jgi:hypothetical protein
MEALRATLVAALTTMSVMRIVVALVHGYRWDRGYPNPAGA